MVFNLARDFPLVISFVFFVWLLALSFFLYRMIGHYNRLTQGIANQDLKTVLGKILAKMDVSEEKMDQLAETCQKLVAEDRLHIKKVGILRFNPFKDTGGNQSFILSLLNEDNSGLILSSLYTRTGSRWYIKKTQKGKGVDLELSKEEEETIKQAKS